MRTALLALLIMVVACSCAGQTETRSQVAGLSSLRIVDQENIAVVPTIGRGFYLSDLNRKHISAKLVVKKGEEFRRDDRRHILNSYEFAAIRDGKVVFKARETSDERSFGKGVKTKRLTLLVVPY